MATKQEYINANAAVAAGTASQHQLDLVNKMAQQAGADGQAARRALKKAGLTG